MCTTLPTLFPYFIISYAVLHVHTFLRLRVTVCYCACAVCACGLQSTVECVHNFGVNVFIDEVTSNRILDWISILWRKGQGGSKSFTEINTLFARYCAFYLPDWAKSEWLCCIYERPSLVFSTAAKRTSSEPPSSRLKTSHGCGLLALSDCKIWRQSSLTRPWTCNSPCWHVVIRC